MTRNGPQSTDHLDALVDLVDRGSIHTVEVATPDTQGHVRGKRVPARRFVERIATAGLNIADAMFVFDAQNDLPDNPYVNMESGFLDCRLIPDLASLRVLSHRPGYALVFADAVDAHGAPHPLSPRARAHRTGRALPPSGPRSVRRHRARVLPLHRRLAAHPAAHPIQLAHRRPAHRGRPAGDARGARRRGDRSRVVELRVRPGPGRDQHRTVGCAHDRRQHRPLQEHRQAGRGATRPAGDVHGQAVVRLVGLGHARPHQPHQGRRQHLRARASTSRPG